MVLYIGIILLMIVIGILLCYIIRKILTEKYEKRIDKLLLNNKKLSKLSKDWKDAYLKEKEKNG
jgi:hypothetical protein